MLDYVNSTVRAIKDFPKEGIIFRDITTATKDAKAFKYIIDYFVEQFKNEKIDYVIGIESRGFVFGSALAYMLNAGFVFIRKPNKLPAETISEEYSLEYGTDKIEIHKDALKEGDRVIIIDDLLATGGTMEAAVKLVKKIGAETVSCAFVIELDDLKGREKLAGTNVVSMLHY